MTVLDEAISPATAVDILGAKGVQISERALRERAREIGAYRQIGRALFFTPADLEKITEPVACLPTRVAPKARTGTRLARSTVSELSEARARLQNLKRGNS